MRKYIHTALIIFTLALPCFGQFTEIWTNGNLFAVNEMASQCYSASVERCAAAGITPDSPSWYDYLIGKNHAKLISVKNNIKAVRRFYTKSDGAGWAYDSLFLSDCGLSTNAINETPYFKSQYPSVTGGWRNVHVMLTNLHTIVDSSFSMVGIDYRLWGSGISTNSYDAAYALAVGNITTNQWGPFAAYSVVLDYSSGSDYYLEMYKQIESFQWTNSTFYGTSVSGVTNFDSHSIMYGSAGDPGVFTNQGDNVSLSAIAYTNWDRLRGDSFGPAILIGDTPIDNPPPYYSDAGGMAEIEGWYLESVWFTHNFTASGLTNGFKYK